MCTVKLIVTVFQLKNYKEPVGRNPFFLTLVSLTMSDN